MDELTAMLCGKCEGLNRLPTRDTPPDHAITLHIRLLPPVLHKSSRHLTDLPTLATLTHTQLYHNEELELDLFFFFSTLTEKYYEVLQIES